MADYEKAKAAGDEAKKSELQARPQHQRQLHLQGFGRVPVDDLLEPVKKEVAQLAEQRLSAITMNCDYVGDDIELVDVTDALVKLYNPSEKTLKIAQEVRRGSRCH